MSSQDYASLMLQTRAGCRLELVPEFGGLINSLRFRTSDGPIEVIAGLASRQAMEEDKGFRGIPLFPVVNRLDGGRFEHMGQCYQLPVNEPERNNTLHGFLHHLQPEVEFVEEGESSEAVLYYRYEGQFAGYPFPTDVEMRFVLSDDNSLDVSISVFNRHFDAIPVGIGWHPYYTLGRHLQELSLSLPPVQRVLVDNRMLPTGQREEYPNFDRLRPMGETELDTCFALAPDGKADIATTLLWSEKDHLGLEIWQQTGDRAYNFMQVFTPPDRRSIAIEPVSCGINALNTGEGLVMLSPRERMTAHMGVRLLTSTPPISP